MGRLGRQFVIVLDGCSGPALEGSAWLAESCNRAATESGLTVVDSLAHAFEPAGVTFVSILSQSHMVVHTWPERSMVVVDLFVCDDAFDVSGLADRLRAVCRAEQVEVECSFSR